MKLRYILNLLAVVLLITSCNGTTKKNNANNCTTLYNQANNKLNEYYTTNNDSCLHQSLNFTEEALSFCPEYKVRLVDLKITLLILLHEYEKGYEFINLLNENDFSKPYKKNLYLKTFKALSYDAKGNLLGRDSCLKEIEAEIGSYISEHSLDEEAIADLFFTKVKHIKKELVIKEIDSLQEKNKKDTEFFEVLKESIMDMPK